MKFSHFDDELMKISRFPDELMKISQLGEINVIFSFKW